jgi:hypothetical protein
MIPAHAFQPVSHPPSERGPKSNQAFQRCSRTSPSVNPHALPDRLSDVGLSQLHGMGQPAPQPQIAGDCRRIRAPRPMTRHPTHPRRTQKKFLRSIPKNIHRLRPGQVSPFDQSRATITLPKAPRRLPKVPPRRGFPDPSAPWPRPDSGWQGWPGAADGPRIAAIALGFNNRAPLVAIITGSTTSGGHFNAPRLFTTCSISARE